MVDAEPFAELAQQLHGEPNEGDTVEGVLAYALKAIGCDYAGVIFVHRGTQIETVSATDPLVEELDRVQMEVGQGPDITALEDVLGVVVADTRSDQRWPDWAGRVASVGIRSLLNVRLYTSEGVIGTLNFYSREPHQFDRDDQAVAHVLARHAAVALSAARKQKDLWQAVDARKRIGQAQGILMERFDLDEERAFKVLLRYSQDHNVKLRLVAEQLIATRVLPGPAAD